MTSYQGSDCPPLLDYEYNILNRQPVNVSEHVNVVNERPPLGTTTTAENGAEKVPSLKHIIKDC